jgi:hypothetical protein
MVAAWTHESHHGSSSSSVPGFALFSHATKRLQRITSGPSALTAVAFRANPVPPPRRVDSDQQKLHQELSRLALQYQTIPPRSYR